MGGIIFTIPTIVIMLLLCLFNKIEMNYSLLIVMISFFGYFLIGLIDDVLIVVKHNNKGLSEGEIFNKHIFKNASIPIVHGIPASILGCLTGSLFTEKVYGVPGIGQEFTKAIEANNNSVILALTLFFASLSIISLILGDVLMAIVDPRISFSNSGGGRK